MSAEVTIESVTKRFGAQRALDGVTLTANRGELVALLGASGCGKTTLLRTVAGLATPDEGRILFDGRDVTHLPTRRRPVGMVFQSYALFPNMTAAGNIAFPLKVRRRPAREIAARVEELLAVVGLEAMGGRYPNQLSGGQQQRVALARAIAPEPAVLLLDEPLSALDAVIRGGLRDEIRRVQQRVGLTALYVTHDQSEALAIADRVAVMASGQIVECAAPSAIYDQPATKVAATFVGSRNALELAVGADRIVRWGEAFAVPAPVESNGRVLAVFRPEDVQLVERDGIEGALDVSVFLGSTTRVNVRVDGELVAVDLPSRVAATLAPGGVVKLRVPADAVRVFALN